MTEQRQIAERQRVRGNEAFKAGQWSEALRCYELGLDAQRHNAALHANAAMAALKMQCYVQASWRLSGGVLLLHACVDFECTSLPNSRAFCIAKTCTANGAARVLHYTKIRRVSSAHRTLRLCTETLSTLHLRC